MSTDQKNMVELAKLLDLYQASSYASLSPLLERGFAILTRSDTRYYVAEVSNVAIELNSNKKEIVYGLDKSVVVVPHPQESTLCQFHVIEEKFERLAAGYEGTFELEFGSKHTSDKLWIKNMSIVGMQRVHEWPRAYIVDALFDRSDVYLQTDEELRAILVHKDTLDHLDQLDLPEE